ncbi:helix-turn-helix domain-containing protein [Pseudomonas asplenii]|uniref:helix-turn-helix domain-containing protein n=1 Tax=Pseudomonas asplenii TaxID=53407 RepID=UPI0037CBF4FA
MHVNQIRRYEAGTAQPTLEALIRLAQALHVSLDDLVFAEGERGPSDDLRLRFEAVSHMPEAEKSYAIHKPHLPNSGLTAYCGISGEQFHGSRAS